jgi:anti-sigma factor RsiW
MQGMKPHVIDTDLALYSSGDLPVWRRAQVWLHVSACERCRLRIEAFRADRSRRRANADQLPEGLDWDRMAAEMTANIHLGLAAGECVSPRTRRGSQTEWKKTLPGGWRFSWRPVALVAGVAVVVSAAWWLNLPASDTEALGRVMHGIARGGRRSVLAEDAGPVVEATSAGVELRQNGGALQVSQSGMHPLTVSVSVQGSASAHYIDTDTGQVTITSVYAQ